MNNDFIQDGKVLYFADWPAELLPCVRTAMADVAYLIPAWCHEVCVTWHPDLTDRAADIDVDVSYRRARLRIAPQFLDQTEKDRVDALRHEMLHISTCPMVDYAKDAIRRLLPDSSDKILRKTLFEGIDERHEGCVQDLMHCIGSQNSK